MSRFTARAYELLTAVKDGNPIPSLVARSVDAETLWPAYLEKEADKAAIILRSFFFDGFVVPYRTLAACQQDMVRKCCGLSVFHLLRDGLSCPTASGSGVLVARLPEEKWSGASAILVDNTASLPPGIDALDVVLIINDKQGMEALLEPAVSLQKCLTVAPGPMPQSDQSPMTTPAGTSAWSYAKSKGELVEMDLSSLVIRDAADKNEQYYGIASISRREILLGQVSTPACMSDYLSNTVKAFDHHSGGLSGLPKPGKCPGDRRIKAPSSGT